MIGVLMLGALLASAPSAHGRHAAPLLAQQWQDLSPFERFEALRHYREHKQLPKSRQQEIERRYRRWQSLSEEEKQRIRKNFERYQNLTESERERFRRKYERWREVRPTPEP